VPDSDEQLVRTAQEGADPEAQRAFAALVDRWKGPVFRVARRRLHDEHDSEEVASETFVLAWRALRSLREPAAFPGWILRIAANQAVNRMAKRNVIRTADPTDRILLELEAPELPLDRWESLQDAFGDVPEEDLSILRLKHEDRKTYEEIASTYGISLSTVRDRLTRARGRVEGALRRHGLLEEFARLLERRRGRPTGGIDG
jgi:RNA polymerase sigma-70 factor, ECF subfamily